jgi:hypothetical protein
MDFVRVTRDSGCYDVIWDDDHVVIMYFILSITSSVHRPSSFPSTSIHAYANWGSQDLRTGMLNVQDQHCDSHRSKVIF